MDNAPRKVDKSCLTRTRPPRRPVAIALDDDDALVDPDDDDDDDDDALVDPDDVEDELAVAIETGLGG